METIEIKVQSQGRKETDKINRLRLISEDTANWPQYPTEDKHYRNNKHFLFKFIDQDTKKPVLILERNSPHMLEIKDIVYFFAIKARKQLDKRTSRSNAIGKNYLESVKMRNKTVIVSQGIQSASFGYTGKYIAGAVPGAFKANASQKDLYFTIKNHIAPQAAKSYWKVLPKEIQDVYVENSKKIEPCYFITKPFTTATLNANTQMACHYDGSNLPKGWSAMPIFYYEDRTEGGDFLLPEYKIRLSGFWGDIPFFPAEETLHGNLPIKSKNGKMPLRISVVLYALASLTGLPPLEKLLDHLYKKQFKTRR